MCNEEILSFVVPHILFLIFETAAGPYGKVRTQKIGQLYLSSVLERTKILRKKSVFQIVWENRIFIVHLIASGHSWRQNIFISPTAGHDEIYKRFILFPLGSLHLSIFAASFQCPELLNDNFPLDSLVNVY